MNIPSMADQSEQVAAHQVIEEDLEFICVNLSDEFSQLAGKNLLITGGAGFLGHYLVQSALRWNQTRSGPPIDVTVFDNYIRGLPTWLKELEGNSHLHLKKHNLAEPLPPMGDFHYIVHAASIASPIYYRKDPIGTMDNRATVIK